MSIKAMLRRRGFLAAATVIASLGFASAASAATYNVNDTRDFPQSTTAASGACVSTASTCTLRAAIQASNENGGSNTINVAAGTYNLSNTSSTGAHSACPSGDDESTYDLKVNDCNNSTAVTVIGAGVGVTVINNSLGSSGARLFTLYTNGTLDLQKMTVENGDGGTSGSDNCGCGGAVYSDGHLSAENTTFTGNASESDEDGGAIFASDTSGSTLTLTGDVFQANMAPSAASGGAVENETMNDATVSFCLFQANSAGDSGGGLDHGSGAAKLTLNFDEFLQNVADSQNSSFEGGGGVADSSGGDLDITNSLFNQNTVSTTAIGTGGGGVYTGTSAIVNVANSSFNGNSVGRHGGGLHDLGSNALNLTLDKFSNNSAGDEGGAVELHSNSTSGATITSSEFDGNQVSGGEDEGGAIDWREGPLTLLGDSFTLNTATYGGALEGDAEKLLTMEDTTMSRNTASGYGGGIYMEGGSNTPATLINDTIAFNNGGTAGGIAYADDFTSGGSAATGFGVENTIVAENSGKDCSNSSGTTETFLAATDTGNNNDSDQTCFGGLGGPNDKTGVNPLLSNPANNGGPVAGGPGDTVTIQTDAEQANSPTVNAGNNNGCPSVDARGVSRPQGSACDMGAFEFGANPTTTTSTVTSTTSKTTTTSKTSTVTSTTTTSHPKPKPKKCKKGHHKSHGRCVKNKKHKKHHKKKHKK